MILSLFLFYTEAARHEKASVGTNDVFEARKRRWDDLNTVLDMNKKTRLKDGQSSVGYSYVNWEQVKTIFPVVSGHLQTTAGKGLPQELLDALHQYLRFATTCFSSITEGREAKRVHFIAPILIIVCSYFNGDIQILADEVIDGNRVHAHGYFEFVLKRGDKRICIVEAKKENILQGRTQSLVGCEALCDVENLSVSYGIATDFISWCFLKNEAAKITEELLTVSSVNGFPTKDSLKEIADKIIAILE